MIKVGVFWAFVFIGVDIIYDFEEYPDDYQSNETILTYSKQHKDVWSNLSREQKNGKYSCYQYDYLPRGRLYYDLEKKSYNLIFYSGSKDFLNLVSPKILSLFGIESAEIFVVGGNKMNRIKPFPQKCVIIKDKQTIERTKNNPGITGYKIFNEKNECIGVVSLDPKYDGRAVIRFRNELKNTYGVWHLIQSTCTFSMIETGIMRDSSIEIIVE